jgi:CRISPR-associated protein Cas2
MIFDFMRLIVFFDLPTNSKEDRHQYSVFRKYLIRQGYNMLQFSIYSKIFNSVDAVNNHLAALAKNVPKAGSIRAMSVTEKQYAKIVILLGNKTMMEERENMSSLIEL